MKFEFLPDIFSFLLSPFFFKASLWGLFWTSFLITLLFFLSFFLFTPLGILKKIGQKIEISLYEAYIEKMREKYFFKSIGRALLFLLQGFLMLGPLVAVCSLIFVFFYQSLSVFYTREPFSYESRIVISLPKKTSLLPSPDYEIIRTFESEDKNYIELKSLQRKSSLQLKTSSGKTIPLSFDKNQLVSPYIDEIVVYYPWNPHRIVWKHYSWDIVWFVFILLWSVMGALRFFCRRRSQ